MPYDIMTADVPNANGRVYPLEVVKYIADMINSGGVPVTLDYSTPSLEVNLDRLIGMAKNAKITDGVLSAEVSIMETPMGVLYDRLLDEDIELSLTVAGTADISDYTIHDYTLIHLFIHSGKNA